MPAIYLVVQHQPCDAEYDNSTIYTYDNQQAAEDCTKRLNLEYAKNVILDEKGLFKAIEEDAYDYHYYEVEAFELETRVSGVYNPADDRTNDEVQVYVIAVYDKYTLEFLGYYGDPITPDKNKATYFNQRTAEHMGIHLEATEKYKTKVLHYNDAEEAKK